MNCAIPTCASMQAQLLRAHVDDVLAWLWFNVNYPMVKAVCQLCGTVTALCAPHGALAKREILALNCCLPVLGAVAA